MSIQVVTANRNASDPVPASGQNQTAGPFMANLPSVPAGWSPSATYAFTASTAAGTFNISAVGDGATVSVP